MAETLYACPTGFLIKNNGDGKFVPFFVKVRSQDIIWDPKDKHSGGGGSGSASTGGGNIQKYGIWTVNLVSSNYYDGTAQIPINTKRFSVDEDDKSMMSGDVELPFTISDKNSFFVTGSLYARNINLRTASVSFAPNEASGGISSVKVTIQSLAYPFERNWAGRSDYTSSRLYIRVSGIMTS